jgi:hypothetical protein
MTVIPIRQVAQVAHRDRTAANLDVADRFLAAPHATNGSGVQTAQALGPGPRGRLPIDRPIYRLAHAVEPPLRLAKPALAAPRKPATRFACYAQFKLAI